MDFLLLLAFPLLAFLFDGNSSSDESDDKHDEGLAKDVNDTTTSTDMMQARYSDDTTGSALDDPADRDAGDAATDGMEDLPIPTEGQNDPENDAGQDADAELDASAATAGTEALPGDGLDGDAAQTGAGGQDTFFIGTNGDDDPAVVIHDFDGSHETVTLAFDPDALGEVNADDLTSSTDPETGDVSLIVADKVIAVLTAPANFDLSRVTISNSESLTA